MPRTNKIPIKPRFDYVVNKAYGLLVEMGFSELPIDPWDIINYYSDHIICLPWTKAKPILSSDDPFHLKQLGADARVILTEFPDQSSKYLIVYDDTVSSPERIRWSIMHELGHIFLLHLKHFDQTGLDRSGLSDSEYGVLEIEAHFFAAEVFAPTDVLKYISGITVDELGLLCSISDEAAEKRYKALYEQTYHPSTTHARALIKNFYGFLASSKTDEVVYDNTIQQWQRFKLKSLPVIKCSKCGSFTDIIGAKYCAFCGEKIESSANDWFSMVKDEFEIAKVPASHHPMFDVDTNDRLLYCPVCCNHEISKEDKYCSICGQPLTNYCVHEGTPLNSRYYYCTECGSQSSFHYAYHKTEEEKQRLNRVLPQDDWIPYPHLSYIRWTLNNTNNALRSLLYYAIAFTDDDDNMIIVCSNQLIANNLKNHKLELLKIIKEQDNPIYENLEVYYIK